MIISLHTPKAGGVSFRELLISHYSEGYHPDYLDTPINKSLDQRQQDVLQFRINREDKVNQLQQNGIECIHGHFLPYKYYSKDSKRTFVTWLRDPLERLGSHYHYWQRSYNIINPSALHRKVVEKEWSFEKFCFSNEMRNIYTQFLWRFPIELFSFIGITEYYEEDVTYFAKEYLGLLDGVLVVKKNVNADKKKSYFSDAQFVKELRDFHSDDYQLYNYALQKRFLRISN